MSGLDVIDELLGQLAADLAGETSPGEASAADTAVERTVNSWVGCVEVLRDGARFSSGVIGDDVAFTIGHSMLDADGEEHRRLRDPFRNWFSRRVVTTRVETIVRDSARRLLAALPRDGTVDLVRSYTKPLPVLVMGAMLGVAGADLERMSRLHREVDAATLQPDRGGQAREELIALYVRMLQARARHPRDDLLSLIAGCFGVHTDAGLALSVAHARLFYDAGTETTYRGATSLIAAALAGSGPVAGRSRTGLKACATAALTSDPPVRLVRRRCTGSTALGDGTMLYPGAVVTPLLARANHDPARPAGRHMAFGWGPHTCLGMHMGLAEMCAGARELFAAYPGLVVERLSVAAPGDTLFRVVPEIVVRLSS